MEMCASSHRTGIGPISFDECFDALKHPVTIFSLLWEPHLK